MQPGACNIDKIPKPIQVVFATKVKAEVLMSFGFKKLADYSKLVR